MNPVVSGNPNAIVNATSWIDHVLTGTLASTVAIISVAIFGLMLMTGRVRRPRAVELIIGCFIIFGARSIAAGLISSIGARDQGAPIAQTVRPNLPISPVARQPSPRTQFNDPYNGAAMPPRR